LNNRLCSSQYCLLQIEGDGLRRGGNGPIFCIEGANRKTAVSSVAIAPANYKFSFVLEVTTGGIGAEVMLTGHLIKYASAGVRADAVRDTKLLNALLTRFTHLGFAIPRLSRGEQVAKEYLVSPDKRRTATRS
jgi:hypothetical protein